MDPRVQQQDRENLRKEIKHDFDGLAAESPLLRIPFFLFNMLASGLRLLKPLAPQLIPLTVFVLAIPVVVFFSLSAGWFVWRSIAVGWETTVYLQYGYGLSTPTLINRTLICIFAILGMVLHLMHG